MSVFKDMAFIHLKKKNKLSKLSRSIKHTRSMSAVEIG